MEVKMLPKTPEGGNRRYSFEAATTTNSTRPFYRAQLSTIDEHDSHSCRSLDRLCDVKSS